LKVLCRRDGRFNLCGAKRLVVAKPPDIALPPGAHRVEDDVHESLGPGQVGLVLVLVKGVVYGGAAGATVSVHNRGVLQRGVKVRREVDSGLNF
jgi:hypothetical protein